ncbi:unnamed protein product [Tilletia controversa]|nr:unnamed protein product [Tilletia controversa]
MPTRMSFPSPHFDADAILAELRESGIQVRELESSLPPLIASASNPPVPAKKSKLQVHNPPSAIHDRSRSNSFVNPASPSLLSPPLSAGFSSSSGSGGGAPPTIASKAMDQHHAAAGGLPSPVPKSTGSRSFSQQEDLGTARDRGLSRQLPSLSSASLSSTAHGHEMGMGGTLSSGGLNLSYGSNNNNNSAAPAATSKSSVGSTFGAYDQSGWGASSTSMGLNGSMSMPPPQEPTLTFGGQDGELSLGDDSRPPAAAPWNPDNPWG